MSTTLDSPPNALPLKLGHRTDPGRSGKNNEDAYDIFEAPVPLGDDIGVTYPASVLVVADGIGGNRGGERASRLAIDSIRKIITHERSLPIIGLVNHAVLLSNQEIYKNSMADSSLRGMGTTIVVALIVEHQLYLAHAGDSRAYLIRDNKILPLTLDHTWVQEAIDAGRLTADAAHNHPNRNVIKRYLGIQRAIDLDQSILDITQDQKATVHKTVSSLPLEPGDALVLCTDGLTDLVTDQEILRLTTQYEPSIAAEQLVDLANKRGGIDNITVVIAELPGGKPKVVAVPFWRRLLPIGLSVAIGLLLLGFILSQVFGQGASEDPGATVSDPGGVETASPVPDTSDDSGNNGALTDIGTPSPASVEGEDGTENVDVPVPVAPTITPFSTSTPVPNFTATATRIPTNTPVPPTRTPSPRPQLPTATREVVVPTNAPAPTDEPEPTQAPAPTNVPPVPSTATPLPAPTQVPPAPTDVPPQPTDVPPEPTDVPPEPTQPPEPTEPPEPTPRPTPPPI